MLDASLSFWRISIVVPDCSPIVEGIPTVETLAPACQDLHMESVHDKGLSLLMAAVNNSNLENNLQSLSGSLSTSRILGSSTAI